MGLALNAVLAGLLFFSGKYKSSLTKAGLANAFLLGFCPALVATQGQNDSFFSQLPYKCYLEEVVSVGG